jgi:MFS transporter, Spinster family, sphingosine-1-phosphate transporter
MLVALSAPRSVVNTMFVICAGTGPTLGVFYGGWIIDKMGGYVGSKQRVISLKICFITGILAGIFATIGSLVDHFYTFICCLWLILFFGASLLPACTGMLVSVVPRKHRPISSSLSIFIFNIFGYSFSLFLSGYLMQVRHSSSLLMILFFINRLLVSISRIVIWFARERSDSG